MPSRIALLLVLLLPMFVGCGRVVFQPREQQPQALTLSPDQQQLFAQQQVEMQRRAEQLDADNQELESLLAQSRQQVQLLTDQIVATQDQLKTTTERLAATQQNNADLKTRTDALVASVKQPTAGAILPNSTMLQPLQLRNAPGVDVRQDGDVIRVALSSDALFYTGSARLQPTGQRLVEGVAGELARTYPDHRIGIEGHTDGAPIQSTEFSTSHHMSVSQASSVYDVLVQGGLPAAQLFVVGHGANHPLVSNATEAGRQKNRRLELVVYPETIRRR